MFSLCTYNTWKAKEEDWVGGKGEESSPFALKPKFKLVY